MNKNAYQRIEQWMYRNARPVDLARWQYHFESGDHPAVIKALKNYQNTDGGFGYGLEPDCWNHNSSPLQTWAATRILEEISVDSKEEVVSGILKYLGSGDSFENNRWQNNIKSNNDHPHAPWWTYKEDAPCDLGFNPTASLAGFILKHAHRESDVYLMAKDIAVEAVTFFLEEDFEDEMHEAACFIQLYEYISEAKLTDLVDYQAYEGKLIDYVNRLIERDGSKWLNNYICKPSQLFKSPESIFYKGNESVVEIEVQFINDTINDEGVWDITWTWSDYQDEFAVSKNWWKANAVISNLVMLKNYKKML